MSFIRERVTLMSYPLRQASRLATISNRMPMPACDFPRFSRALSPILPGTISGSGFFSRGLCERIGRHLSFRFASLLLFIALIIFHCCLPYS